MATITVEDLYVTTAELKMLKNKKVFLMYRDLQELARGKKRYSYLSFYKDCYKELREVFPMAKVDKTGINWCPNSDGVFTASSLVRCELLKVLLEQPQVNIYPNFE